MVPAASLRTAGEDCRTTHQLRGNTLVCGKRYERGDGLRAQQGVVSTKRARHTVNVSSRPGSPIEDRFVLEAAVARGAFGEVLRGTERATGRPVAIKRLLAGAGDPVAVERFELEARLLAKVDSPHVVRYVAHGCDATGRPCLVLEWLEGVDLHRYRRVKALSVPMAVEVVRQIALGLDALHRSGIVHRDVKPSNVFVIERPDGGLLVKLIDLGIARAVSEPALTIDGMRLGTPAYMSPEQARGERNVGPTSDIFSLGVVCFELLTGRRPFVGTDPFAVLVKILLEQPPRPKELVPELPAVLDELVMRALAKDPARRWPSARELADQLSVMDGSLTGVAVGSADVPTVALNTGAVSQSYEQRVVTAVFVDLSPRLSVDDDHDVFAEIAASHGGSVQRILGGRAVALFGFARSVGDEAVRAARTALEVSRALAGVRVAVITCKILTRDEALDGEAIERGARLLERAREGVPIDGSTARLLEGRFVIEGSEREPVLRGERRETREDCPRLLGRETRTVGRERELATLETVFDECVSESVARAVLVTGVAGVGKSRVRYELFQRLRRRDDSPEVFVGYGDPVRAGSPLSLLAQMVRDAAGVVDGAPVEIRRKKLRIRVGRHLPPQEVPRVSAFLGEMIGTPFEDGEDLQLRAARADAMLMSDQVRRAWEDFLSAECAVRPVVLVLEDLQWGDAVSVKFVDAVLRNLGERPLMVVAFARPEVQERFPRLWASCAPLTIPLRELSRRACEQLVREVLGSTVSTELVARVVERAAGNAFYLEELIRAVAEGRGEALPDTVLASVQARLDALDPEARRVLRFASVFGQAFWRGAVETIQATLWPATRPRDWIGELLAAEIVTERRESRFAGETEYVFRHALLREAAYVTLTEEDRCHAHRLAADWLIRVGEQDAMVIARHFEHGGERERAVEWYLRAAEQALGRNDLEGTIARAERGLICGAEGNVRGMLRAIQAEAHQWRGENAEAVRCGKEAMALLTRGSTPWLGAMGQVALSAGRLGDAEELSRLGRELEDIRLESDNVGARLVAAALVAVQLVLAGRVSEAMPLFDRIEAVGGEIAARDPAVGARLDRVRAQRADLRGDLGAFLTYAERAAAGFEQVGDLRNASAQLVNVGAASVELGEYERAERALQEAIARGERMGSAFLVLSAKVNLGLLLIRRGAFEQAVKVLAETLEGSVAQGDRRTEGYVRTYLARALLLQGNLDRAEQEASAAMTVHGSPAVRVLASATLAHVLLAEGRIPAALQTSEEAMTAMEAMGGLQEEGEAYVRWVHIEALCAAGRWCEAREALAQAKQWLQTRAAKITDPALQNSFLTRVQENARIMALAESDLASTTNELPSGHEQSETEPGFEN